MIGKILKSLRENKRCSILTAVFAVLEVGMEVAIPIFIASLIDEGIQNENISAIVKYGCILSGAAVLALIFGTLSGRFSAKASTGLARNLRHDIYVKTQGYSFANLDKFPSSTLISRMTTDVFNILIAYQQAIRMLIRTPIMLIFAIVMAFTVSVPLAFIFLGSVPVMAIGLFLIESRAFPSFMKGFMKYDDLNLVVQEDIRGMRVVKSFVREDEENKKFLKGSTEIRNHFTKANKIVAFQTPLLQFCIYAGIILLSWFGAKMIVGGIGGFSTGKLMSLLTYSVQILSALQLMSFAIIMLIIAKPSAKRIIEVLEEESSIKNPLNPIREMTDGEVEFNNVSFSYHGDQNKLVLSGVNIKIKQGETVGIIGGTASAKSTLVNLIPRLYDVSGGEVKIGGINVKDYDLQVLRDNVAVVLQKNVLFSGSVKENLRWGKDDATDEEIKRACSLACASEFVEAMENGYNSRIEQGGSNVSGGQKQRLCIARALLKNPKILILDDSTSAVDTKTEAKIFKAFKTQIPHVTKFIISQRISSVEHADKILVLDEGRIVGEGTHAELIKSCKIYKEVAESQNRLAN